VAEERRLRDTGAFTEAEIVRAVDLHDPEIIMRCAPNTTPRDL
jgi:hypothetical protein